MPPKKIKAPKNKQGSEEKQIALNFLTTIARTPKSAYATFSAMTIADQMACTKRVYYRRRGITVNALEMSMLCLRGHIDPQLIKSLFDITPVAERISSHPYTGKTLWHLLTFKAAAAKHYQAEIANYFLKFDNPIFLALLIKPNCAGITPLENMISNGSYAATKLLFDALPGLIRKGYISESALQPLYPKLLELAIYAGNFESVKYLVENLKISLPTEIDFEKMNKNRTGTDSILEYLTSHKIVIKITPDAIPFDAVPRGNDARERRTYKNIVSKATALFLSADYQKDQIYQALLKQLKNCIKRYNKNYDDFYFNLPLIYKYFEKFNWNINPAHTEFRLLAFDTSDKFPLLLIKLHEQGLSLNTTIPTAKPILLTQPLLFNSTSSTHFDLVKSASDSTTDYYGRTIAHVAAQYNLQDQSSNKLNSIVGSATIVRALFNTANMFEIDRFGLTPCQYVTMNPDIEQRNELLQEIMSHKTHIRTALHDITAIATACIDTIILEYLGFDEHLKATSSQEYSLALLERFFSAMAVLFAGDDFEPDDSIRYHINQFTATRENPALIKETFAHSLYLFNNRLLKDIKISPEEVKTDVIVPPVLDILQDLDFPAPEDLPPHPWSELLGQLDRAALDDHKMTEEPDFNPPVTFSEHHNTFFAIPELPAKAKKRLRNPADKLDQFREYIPTGGMIGSAALRKKLEFYYQKLDAANNNQDMIREILTTIKDGDSTLDDLIRSYSNPLTFDQFIQSWLESLAKESPKKAKTYS